MHVICLVGWTQHWTSTEDQSLAQFLPLSTSNYSHPLLSPWLMSACPWSAGIQVTFLRHFPYLKCLRVVSVLTRNCMQSELQLTPRFNHYPELGILSDPRPLALGSYVTRSAIGGAILSAGEGCGKSESGLWQLFSVRLWLSRDLPNAPCFLTHIDSRHSTNCDFPAPSV